MIIRHKKEYRKESKAALPIDSVRDILNRDREFRKSAKYIGKIVLFPKPDGHIRCKSAYRLKIMLMH